MIADFVSAEFGWLRSPDGTRSARKVIKPGKNREGYFTNKDILRQAKNAMDILDEFYPEYEHMFVYDNATTYWKRADDALSARKMPRNISKPDANWLVEVNQLNNDGNQVHTTAGKFAKKRICMCDATLPSGAPQPLYFPDDHP
ncbi:hypothetical protein CPB85DRAFT_1166508, partial [Mucidula mucida]